MTTIKEKKISSVAVEKKRIMDETFEKKGLPTLLSEIKFSIDPDLTSKELLKKLTSAIKRKFKKDYFNHKPNERYDYINRIQIDEDLHIHAEDSSRMSDEEIDKIKKLLHACFAKADRKAYKVDDIEIGKITITAKTFQLVGYTAMNIDVAPGSHNGKWKLRGFKDYELVFDVSSLIAEIIVMQSLWKYSKEHTEAFKHGFLEYTQKLNKHFWVVPTKEDFRDDFLKFAISNGYLNTSIMEWKELNEFAPYFYGQLSPLEEMDFRHMEHCKWIRLIVREFVQQANYATYDAIDEINTRSDYAKSFQMKKHIKQSHVERMNNNVFLSFYGEVELDNDVDLDKFTIIEENLKELQKVVSIPRRKDYHFKIRRLGNHRAAGLFYSYFKTTIFDLNYPDSYVHELGHQIDHVLSEGKREDWFSETSAFRSILRTYRALMEKKVSQMSDDSEFKKQWNGKTKYNKMYYLKPTEVFARSFEVYMTKFNLHNSLLKTEEELRMDEPYLFDAEYLSLVHNVFDDVMKRVADLPSTIEETPKEEESIADLFAAFDIPPDFFNVENYDLWNIL